MDVNYYNWEEIFKDKSNKELYDIYKGSSTLPKLTIPFAKKELENRNFDFENMDANKSGWKLSELIEKEDFYEAEAFTNKFTYISWKIYLLIVIGMSLFFFLLSPKGIIYVFPMIIVIASFILLLNNFLFIRQQKYISIVRKEKQEMLEKLEKCDLLDKKNSIYNEIEKEREKSQKFIKIILIITTLLTILVSFLNK